MPPLHILALVRSALSAALGCVLLLFALLACGMKSGTSTSPSASASASAVAPVASSSGPREFVVVDIKVGSEGIVAAIQVEMTKAETQKKTPFLELWATWCAPCTALAKSLDDPRMKAAFRGTYIIRVDVDTLGPSALRGTGFSGDMIPAFFEIGKDGKATGRSINGGAWGDNVPENMAPPLGAFFHKH